MHADVHLAGVEGDLNARDIAQVAGEGVHHGTALLVAHTAGALWREAQHDGIGGHRALVAHAVGKTDIGQAFALKPQTPGALVSAQRALDEVGWVRVAVGHGSLYLRVVGAGGVATRPARGGLARVDLVAVPAVRAVAVAVRVHAGQVARAAVLGAIPVADALAADDAAAWFAAAAGRGADEGRQVVAIAVDDGGCTWH